MSNMNEQKELIQIIDELRLEIESKKQDSDKIERLHKRADELESKRQEDHLKILELEKKEKELKDQLNLMEKQALRLDPGENLESKKAEIKELLLTTAYKGQLPQGMEVKYYRTDFNPEGGYLAPPDYYNQILEKVREISPMRQLATIATSSRGEIFVPVSNNNSRSFWVGQGGTATRSQATFEQKKIPIGKLVSSAAATWESITDSMFNIEEFITNQFVQSMAEVEGTGFVRGAGGAEPLGFLFDPTVNVIDSSLSGTFSSDDIMTLPLTLKTPYTSNGMASFLFNREAMRIIRTFKSTSQYLWENMTNGAPPTINGYRYFLAEDMDPVAANSRSVAFGNWQRGYMIAEQPQMRLIRDEYTGALQGQVEFIATRRVGGNVTIGEAISVLRCAV